MRSLIVAVESTEVQCIHWIWCRTYVDVAVIDIAEKSFLQHSLVVDVNW